MQQANCRKKSAKTQRIRVRSCEYWIAMKTSHDTAYGALSSKCEFRWARLYAVIESSWNIYETSTTVRPISNITPPMVAAKCHHHFFCAFCDTCARHETKSLFWFRFGFFLFPFCPVYHVPKAIARFNFSFSRPLFWCHAVDASQKYLRFVAIAPALRLPYFQFDSIFSSSPISREAKQRDERESIKNHRE